MTIRFRNMSPIAAAALLLAVTPVISWGQGAGPPVQEEGVEKVKVAELIAVLKSDAGTFDKAKACQRLAVVGTKEAVPALAALLTDEKLSTYARFGLEPIPDPSVDDALRDALGTLDGQLLVGVINSIGVRHDIKAVDALTKLASDPRPEIAAAALSALGHIATAPAVQTLQESLASGSAALRLAAADACLVGVDQLLVQNKRKDAIGLCDAVRRADLPLPLRAAAMRGAILARQSAGVPLLLEQLKSDEDQMFAAALRASRELSGRGVTASLVTALDGLTAARQVLLIHAIGDRCDATALPQLRQRAAGGPSEVRAAAIRVLGQLEDDAAVTVVLDATLSGNPVLVQAARESLSNLAGETTDQAIVTNLDRADPRTRAVLLDLVGELSIASALPSVIKASHDPDERVRLAAIRTLGRIVDVKVFSVLTDRLGGAESPAEEAAVQEALHVACGKSPDPDACVGTLLNYLPDAPISAKCFTLELLGGIGGARALKAVSAAAEDSNEEVQDAATRVLGTWMSADARPELLRLANTLASEKLRIRTLRGYIRIAQQMALSPEQKLEMCKEAFKAAQRDDERRLALGVLSHIHTPGALSVVLPHLDNPALVKEAAASALAIGEKIVQAEPRAVADAMRQILESGVGGEQAALAKKLLQRAGS